MTNATAAAKETYGQNVELIQSAIVGAINKFHPQPQVIKALTALASTTCLLIVRQSKPEHHQELLNEYIKLLNGSLDAVRESCSREMDGGQPIN